jgi:hypothetical protein
LTQLGDAFAAAEEAGANPMVDVAVGIEFGAKGAPEATSS